MTIVRTKRSNGTRRIRIKLDEKSKVEQSHKKEVNINTLVKKYQKTGLLPHRLVKPTYGDFIGVTDYHEAQNRLIQAEKEFMMLPSEIRNRFKNDPGLLLAFVNAPENAEEAAKMGLIEMPVRVPEEPKESTTEPAGPPAEPVVEEVQP